MSENRVPGKPDQQSLDGVLNELRDVLSSLPSSEAATLPPGAPAEFKLPLEESGFLPKPPAAEPPPEPVQPAPAAPVFEIVTPIEIAPGAIPAVPRGIETNPENWPLLAEDHGREVPTPVLDGVAAPAAQAPTWLQPEAGIAPEPEPVPVMEAPAALPNDAFAELGPPSGETSAMDSLLPIPGTVEVRESAAVAEPEGLDLETAEARPEGLVQIACLFPEGEEKTGQAFVNRLRDAGGRQKKPMTIQPVFLHTWSAGAVDVSAWATSAALSGADAMFVIVPRASQNLFPTIAEDARKAGTAGRVIVIEHLQSPALYADVLVELKRRGRGSR